METMLDAVETAGAGAEVDTNKYDSATIHVQASEVTSGGIVLIQTTLDSSNWATVDTHAITADGTYETVIDRQRYRGVRANLSARTDGIYTVLGMFWKGGAI